MRIVLAVLCVFAFVGISIYGLVANINFERKCEGYLKRAADSNTVDLAKENMQLALKYIEEEGLVRGYSNVLWRTPKHDIEFWYKNLSASLQELNSMSPEAAPLERSNMLMKLRETLLDEGQDTHVTLPPQISIFPNQRTVVFGGFIALILGIVFFIPWEDL